MNPHPGRIAFACLLSLCSLPASAAPQKTPAPSANICATIRGLFASNTSSKYSVERSGQDESEFEYSLHFKGERAKARLHGFCGHATGSLCEMELDAGQGEPFQFTLPSTIRVLQIADRVYIVNGIEIDGNHKVTARDYTVNELHPESLQLLCDRF